MAFETLFGVPKTRNEKLTLYKLVIVAVVVLMSIMQVQGGNKLYKESCSNNQDCVETHNCDRGTWTCDCVAQNKVFQHFDSKRKMCVSVYGSICTLKKLSNLPDFECIPNADCKSHGSLSRSLGICICKSGYIKTRDHLCASEEEMTKESKTGVTVSSSQGVDLSIGSQHQWVSVSGSHHFKPSLFCWTLSIFALFLIYGFN